jgi:hypothetical protein
MPNMLLLLPDDVLRFDLRPYLCTEDALNVMDVIGFKVQMHAPIELQKKMNVIRVWADVLVKACNQRTAERITSTLESMVAVGKDLLRLQPHENYLKWKTQMILTIDNNIEIIYQQLYGLDYYPQLPSHDLSLLHYIDRHQKLITALEKNEVNQHRRRLA